mmetsp:Transcript_135474/g.433294  ORF Transcript_135474/g.433294 Transcript_135474/m.433294 type:complete len:81 (-) Transcript_135474:64-306(-)
MRGPFSTVARGCACHMLATLRSWGNSHLCGRAKIYSTDLFMQALQEVSSGGIVGVIARGGNGRNGPAVQSGNAAGCLEGR